jgi:hypothetical protein
MKALTIWQPWASLIMAGAKPWEWRGWRAPRGIIGRRIVIHAGARKPLQKEIVAIIEGIQIGDSSLIADIALNFFDRVPLCSYHLACGLGTAILGESIPALDWAQQHDKSGLDSDRIDDSKWAWPLTDIQPFEPPIPCRGVQGFWNWPSSGLHETVYRHAEKLVSSR